MIVAPLGSGGTVAGLLAGAARYRPETRVLGVQVAVSRLVSEALVLSLAWSATRRRGIGVGPRGLARQLDLDGRHLGRGYGWPTADGDAASRVARRAGITLDPTYTAKTFAKCLELVGYAGFARKTPGRRPAPARPQRVLYWHTLSAAALEPLIGDCPADLPPGLRRRFLPARRG